VIVTGRSEDKSPGNGRIIYRQLDISKEEEVLDLGSWLRNNRKILKGIVHAAGTNSRRLLKEMSVNDIMHVAGPKILGLRHITNHLPLDQLSFLVSYSSIAAVWGSGMLSHYAAANAWMDAFTLQLRKQGIPARTINWGPWEGSNMMLETKDSVSLLQESGIPAFNAGVIRRNYASLLTPASGQLVYVRLNNHRFISMMELRGPLAFWENLRPAEKDIIAEANKSINLSRIEDDMKRALFIEHELGRMVKQVLGIAAEEDIDATKSFSDMGMDSILLVKYVQCINTHLGTAVTTNMIFNYPTVSALSGYMNGLFMKTGITRIVKENRLDNMSDEDVLKMVSEEMQKY
jgi:NAD(P)-dependent dehydrogenase (short-subunit alcohol dehydrogenase family)/acyl carrier protein